MPIEIYIPGRMADIYAYHNPRNEALAVDFIDGLNSSDQSKLTRLLEAFVERGEIRNTEKFKHEKDGIFAFKSYQVRILCFYLPDASKRSVVLTHGFIKKREELPPKEFEKALRIRKEIV